jgi:hypothetical protein
MGTKSAQTQLGTDARTAPPNHAVGGFLVKEMRPYKGDSEGIISQQCSLSNKKCTVAFMKV